MLTLHDFNVGDTVIFGRKRGEKTRGTVISKGRTKLKIRQDESRGSQRDHAIGTIWTVPPSLCRKTSDNVPVGEPLCAPPVTGTEAPSGVVFLKGEKVVFNDRQGYPVVGFVKRVNRKTISVALLGSTQGRYWRVSPHLLRKVA